MLMPAFGMSLIMTCMEGILANESAEELQVDEDGGGAMGGR
jgi:hypothetical protein